MHHSDYRQLYEIYRDAFSDEADYRDYFFLNQSSRASHRRRCTIANEVCFGLAFSPSRTRVQSPDVENSPDCRRRATATKAAFRKLKVIFTT
ncbi:MAG: hypothetical protein MZU97_19830 [Bacillus subtilis]|nr:hypothetical protein [Bacillus subtilis]